MGNNTSRLTVDQLQAVVPKHTKIKITDNFVNRINNSITDPVMRQQYKENIIGYSHILKEGKFKLDQYIDAVRYASFKFMGNNNQDAYIKTFPDRYQSFLEAGREDISPYVHAYRNNKLVNLILEQAMTPVHILNMDEYQKAIKVQAELMVSAKSEKVRSDAANSLMTHLKAPETRKIEVDVAVAQDRTLDDIRSATRELVAAQREKIINGDYTARDIANSQIIDAPTDD